MSKHVWPSMPKHLGQTCPNFEIFCRSIQHLMREKLMGSIPVIE
jgi:hypothetical protein